MHGIRDAKPPIAIEQKNITMDLALGMVCQNTMMNHATNAKDAIKCPSNKDATYELHRNLFI